MVRIVAILSGTAAVMLAMVPAAAAQDPAGLQRRCERMGLEIGVTGDNVKRYAAACIQNGGRPPDPRPFMPAKTTPAPDPAALQRRCEQMGLEIGVTGENVKRYAAACVQNGGRPPDPRRFMPAKTTPAPDPAARARRCERAAAEMGLRGSPRAAYLARCERG